MIAAMNAGDAAWMLLCSALVFLVIPGMIFFYGGPARHSNLSSILVSGLAAACLLWLQWALFGYSLAFGPDHGGWIGNLAWAGLRDVGLDPNLEYAGTVPHQAFMLYHGMLAVIPAVLILMACGERMKPSAYLLFTVLWATLVYDPVAHWVWGVGGFLRASEVLDFAGGIVVHLSAGVAALVTVLVLGKRRCDPSETPSSQNLFSGFGACLLWFGWFGMSAGSALSAGSLAAGAFVMTQTGAASGGLAWALLDAALRKRPTTLGMMTGVVTGLVAITPAAGFVTFWGAIGIGMGAALISYGALAVVKTAFGNDDAFDVFGVHGVGGMWGAIATGLWATKSVNPNGANGFFYGNPAQLVIQVKATLATIIYSFLMSWGLLKLVDLLVGLRTSEHSLKVE